MIQPQTLEIKNGEKIPAIFSKEEMDNRLQAIRSLMEEQKLDGILFTSFHNINYFDHFLYTAFGRNYGLWLPGTGFVQSPRTLTEVSPGGVELVET